MSAPTGKYLSKLANKRVLVLGGTSGIGFCVAEAALEHGAEVIVSNSNQPRLDAALARLRTAYPDAKIRGYTCDLSDAANVEANVDSLLSRAAADGTKIHHVAFTAGDSLPDLSLANATVASINAALAVRFAGAVSLAKLLPRYMDLDPANSLTLTGGTNTDKPSPGWSVLAGVGGAVEALSRGLAVDLKPVRVNLVSPGAVKTELFERVDTEMGGQLEAAYKAQTTTGEIGRPGDVAEAYIYLMKDRFASGAIVNTNGGRLLA